MKKICIFVLCLGFCLALGSRPARASSPPDKQDTDPKKAKTSGQSQSEEKARVENLEVIVTAPRMDIPLNENPAATTVVETAVLKTMSRAIAADEALRLVPGVKVDNQANGERVHLSIRGQGILTERGIRGIKVLLDGLPLNDPTGFAPDLFDVDWSTLRRIEVLRGAAASLYGGGAAGGILNIITRDGGPDPVAAQGFLALGSNNFWKAQAEAGGSSGNMNYRFSAARTYGDGYRVHTKFWANNLYGKFRWQVGPSLRLTAIAGWTDYFNENAEGLNLVWLEQDRRMANPDALTFNEYQKTGRTTGGLTGSWDISSSQDLSFSLYFRTTRWRESVPSSIQHRLYSTPGLNLQYSVRTGSGRLNNTTIAGADLEWQAIGDTRYPNLGGGVEGSGRVSDQNINQRGLGVYLIDRVELGPDWGIIFSLRHDDIHNRLADKLKAGGIDLTGEASFKKTTARVGLTWNPLPRFGLYASWGLGFLPPATEELANNPEHLGGFNIHLVPATSYTEEIGARGTVGENLYYDVAVFHLATKNDFGRYRMPTRPLETFYRNVGDTKRYGVETLISWHPAEPLSVNLAYTYSHFKYGSYMTNTEILSGTWLPNSPGHQANLDVRYSFSPRWMAGIGTAVLSRAYIDATNAAWIDGYTLLNARLAYLWDVGNSTIELSIQARNILGTKYIAFTEPDPDGNSYQPGPTQEVFFSIRIMPNP